MSKINIFLFGIIFYVSTVLSQGSLKEEDVLRCIPFRVNISEVVFDILPSRMYGTVTTVERNIYVDYNDEFFFTISNGRIDCWSNWFTKEEVFIKRIREVFNCVFSDPEVAQNWLDTVLLSEYVVLNKNGVSQSFWKDYFHINIVMRKPKYSVSIVQLSIFDIRY